jgi:hypothetical protein
LPLARRTHALIPRRVFASGISIQRRELAPPGLASASQVRAFDYYDFTPSRSPADFRLSSPPADCNQRFGPSSTPPGNHQHFFHAPSRWAFKTARTISRAIGEQQHQDHSTPPFIYQISVCRSHSLQPQRRPQRAPHLPEIAQDDQFERRHLLWSG